MKQINALLSERYKIDPEVLSDQAWARLEQQRQFIESYENKRFEANFRNALIPILNELFKKD